MKFKLLGITALVLLTFLMIYDFFPKFISYIYIPKSMLLGLILLTFLIGIFMSHFDKGDSSKVTLIWQVVSLAYLFALIMIFTLVGGVSQVGLSLTDPFLWIVFFISIFDIVKGYKKMKVSQLNSDI
ncbi:hypothetical protein ACFSFY_10150 [Sporosarcina siberiensis]|uniref:Uncharacterized protein n=1 Tax=Sporosarcina siberiensis TaxID=1365606 RepID=A0ABW4SG18_9BACL